LSFRQAEAPASKAKIKMKNHSAVRNAANRKQLVEYGGNKKKSEEIA
jgi:hypothetical protein